MIAIDPGVNGGIAWYEDKAYCHAMPETETDVVELLRSLRSAHDECFIEKVGGFAGKGQPGSAMFNFGRGVGVLIGALICLQYRIIEVPPVRWQKPYGNSKGMTKTEWKNKLKGLAQKYYPECKVTLKTADSLLILEYARNLHMQK